MRKLVIAKRGAGGIGKSSANKCVCHLLEERGFSLLLKQWQHREDTDIMAIFDVHGIKVGIESQGDPGSDMEETMKEFVAKGCDIIITACRTKSSTFDKVRYFLGEQNNYDILWYAHYVYQAPNAMAARDDFNRRYAEQVVQLIEDRINNRF